VHDVPGDFVKRGVKHLSGYEILGCRLDFTGICPECKVHSTRKNDEPAPVEENPNVQQT
jgi:hypothetical protein